MAQLKPFEQLDSGGVDSRSNPLNMPRNRTLRCTNWVPRQAGFWELRWGYSTVSMSAVSATAISGIFPYRLWNGSKLVLFVQGTSLKSLDTATGIVTTPTVRGTAISSSAKGQGVFVNNKFFYGNGTDQKWFDSTTWRNNGLPTLTVTQISNISISEGVREFTAAQAATVSLSLVNGGTFLGPGPFTVYAAVFDISNNEIGPATIACGTITTASGKSIQVSNLPNWSGVNTNWAMILAYSGGAIAYFACTGFPTITSCTRSGTTLTVVCPGHGMSTGNAVGLQATTNFDGIYAATVIDANTFTVMLPSSNTGANTTGGQAAPLITVPNGSTTGTFGRFQYVFYQANQVSGLAASTIGGANPGYQFYASIYNPTAGQHVGNCSLIGQRFLQTNYRCNVHVSGLPDLSGTDSEWCVLIGRTGDGALVPYPCTDSGANWLYALSAQTMVIVSDGFIDGQHEMPTRNGIIPSQCNMFCLAGDNLYAADTGSPYLRRSGSIADELAGNFTGDPAQSWAGDDLETFPTAEAIAGIFEVDQEVFCGTIHDTAIATNLAGVVQWIGPWQVGLAGPRAATKCGSHGFYWLTGEKQICTLTNGVPVPISEEYEAAELSQIGDAYLSQAELVYYRNPKIGKDELLVNALDSNGNPIQIKHDFKLIDIYNPPGSVYGQGYDEKFQGPLSSAYTAATVRDSMGKLQIYCGASNGHLYQLYSGADDVGNQYNADAIFLINGGPDRPNVPYIDFYGDGNIQMTLGRNLQTSLDPGATYPFASPSSTDDSGSPQVVQGSEQDFRYRYYLEPDEVQRLYVRLQLTSHSADGNLNLNNPPHVPLETYGRLYEIVPTLGDERGN